ncbi:carboxyl-terminal processing protease [Moheibacter sediminis]|uniref:Carboxyl-terminal processing protease n=2 Tax=Moheibacter sediminis TaxID=1434700 RepID=A0A1W2CU69_9FLAO|nr:carboxyl-terminal processing protease [Moheibacter sediminis]
MLMKKTFILLSFLSMCFLAFCFCTPDLGTDDSKIKTIIKNVRNTLTYMHYRPQQIDDNFSEDVFKMYLEKVDPSKRYFLKSDFEHFKKDIHNLDDYFNNQDLTFYHSTVDTIYKRISETKAYSDEILKKPFDFTTEEDLLIGDDLIQYAADKKEAKELWRKYLKYNTLLELVRLQEDSTNVKKAFKDLEKEAREKVAENTTDFFRRMEKRKKDEYLTLYINSFTEKYDPHTSYFSPQDKDDFDVSISGQLEGIGARLQDKKGNATIMELVIGGPAWKDGQLEVGDQITHVKQKGEDPVNIVGMLLDEAIRHIRGKKGTEVILTVKKKDGSIKDIKLIRDVIEQEEVFARSAVIEDGGDKYGVIYLPEFYTNFNDKNGRDPSDDISKEIIELKKENIKGLIFDLRYNGGGSLEEVVEIAGLFIPKGPIVQVRRSDGQMKVHEDRDPSVLYDGPLVIMVNELSASASEILAAAMQDYGRAVIIGSNKTYGKGTVQTFIPLDQHTYNPDEYGSLKLTIQKFYRVNGGSTQLRGVTPDITLTDMLTYADISEGKAHDALPWDQIKAVKFDRWAAKFNIDDVKAKSANRLKGNAYLDLMEKGARYYQDLDKIDRFPLNLEKYKADRKMREDKSKQFDSIDKYKTRLKIKSPAYELPKLDQDTILGTRRKNWHKDLSNDFYLEESVNVLKDIS